MKKIFFFFFVASNYAGVAQSWQDTTLMIEKILSRYTPGAPGAQLAISRGGKVIYSFANGLADLEHKVPLTKESLIEAGSVSKQFTAASILLLEQQGNLSLNDNIRKYLPEIRDYGKVITLRHLLQHTSGLKDWGSLAEIAGWPRSTKAYTNEDALYLVSLQQTLNNLPGDEYIYSNSNYNLLAIIVQRVSGMSLAEFSAKHIFLPAGMMNTSWRDNYRRVMPNRAIAYSKFGPVFLTTMPNENAYGNGGLLTTAEDLLKWTQYYLEGKFGTPSLLKQQTQTRPLNNGSKNSYASGLVVDSTNGWASITHSGATAGYRANLEHYPALDLTIAWLSNTSQQDLSDIFSQVRNLLVKKPGSESKPGGVIRDSSLQADLFTRYMGAYKQAQTGGGLVLFVKDGTIYSRSNATPWMPITPNSLAAGNNRIEFTATPRGLRFINGTGNIEKYEGVDSARTDSTTLKEYLGSYYSAETESTVRVIFKSGRLVLFRRVNLEAPLAPIYKDGFSFAGGDLYFTREKKGQPKKFFISISRARNVEFTRQ